VVRVVHDELAKEEERGSRVTPLGVANQMASGVSSMAVTELEGRPLAVVKVVMWPLRRRLTPPLSVAAHTEPSGLWWTA
jgi:hypothetical protein